VKEARDLSLSYESDLSVFLDALNEAVLDQPDEVALDASLGVRATLTNPGRNWVIKICLNWQNLGKKLSNCRRPAPPAEQQ